MGRIRQMDEHLATLIAAGEVVAGPGSVVKELVDNALDAGATSIDIAIEGGGLHSIRVADNGSGMDEEDALSARDRVPLRPRVRTVRLCILCGFSAQSACQPPGCAAGD